MSPGELVCSVETSPNSARGGKLRLLGSQDLGRLLLGLNDPAKLPTRCQLVVEFDHRVRSAQENRQTQVDLLCDPKDEW